MPRVPRLRDRDGVEQQASRSGTFANGMDFLTWGGGPRTMLFIPGGPGSGLPKGMMARMSRRWFVPFLDAGFTVWYVTRRRHMPDGHTLADMADDYADAIATELGGRVDLVVGESMGGMIAQYLAASHPDRLRHVALVIAGCEVCDWGKQVDRRLAAAIARGDTTAVGMTFAEYVLPSDRTRWLRRFLGPILGRRLVSGSPYPAHDLLIEVLAEEAFDSRAVLPRIRVPVLLACGDRDQFFPKDVVEETAALIPGSELVWYAGQGHMKTATDRRVPRDVLAFVDRH